MSIYISDTRQAVGLDSLLRESLRRAIHSSHLSIEQIADELSRRSGRSVTVPLLNAWKATGHKWRLPADILPHLCEILGDDSIQRLVLSDKLREALEFGESTDRVVSQLRRALKEPRRRSKR